MADTGWKEFKSAVDRKIGELSVKAEELTESVKEGIHRKALSERLLKEYESLGRLTYKRLSANETEESAEETERIAAIVGRISKLLAELEESKKK